MREKGFMRCRARGLESQEVRMGRERGGREEGERRARKKGVGGVVGWETVRRREARVGMKEKRA